MVKAAQICPGDHVLEIGSGQGILTRAILESQAKLVTAVEVDRRLFAELEKSFGQDDRVRLVLGDILKIDLDEVAGKDTKLRIMVNLPYCITSPILFQILDRRDAVCDAVVTVQKEVASRLTAAPHSKAYGIPTVLFRVFGQVDALFDIPRTAFFPVPAV